MKEDLVERVRGPYPLADDDPRWRHKPRRTLEAALRAGATVIQLRLKITNDAEALELARWAVARAHETEALVVINDRYDLADLSGAGGVHLGWDDLPAERVPKEVRERLVIGLSTHTLEQVQQSRDRPVDYIAFGPVFGTTTKKTSLSARGARALAEAVRIASHPVVAIGGITPENVALVRKAGASAFAVVSAVADARDPAEAVRELARRFGAET